MNPTCMEHLSDFIAGKIVVSMNENMYDIGGHVPSDNLQRGDILLAEIGYHYSVSSQNAWHLNVPSRSCQNLDDLQPTASKQKCFGFSSFSLPVLQAYNATMISDYDSTLAALLDAA